jgi:CheY-like chemotaxis protein
MHGGQVSAHSGGPGRGARFEVRLPVLAELELAREDPVTQSSLAKRILVVDDNVDAGDSLAMVLNLSGHTAEAVYDPLKALERAASFDPEVILLDIGLPGMDGYEVARRIRARGSTARLVALTGYGQSEDIRRTQAAGFDAHLVKPVELEHLLHNLDGPRH